MTAPERVLSIPSWRHWWQSPDTWCEHRGMEYILASETKTSGVVRAWEPGHVDLASETETTCPQAALGFPIMGVAYARASLGALALDAGKP